MDKINSNIYIKKHWSILSHYFNEILCSKTIKSIIITLYPDDKIFLDRNSMINILNNIRFFNLDTDFIGKTKKNI